VTYQWKLASKIAAISAIDAVTWRESPYLTHVNIVMTRRVWKILEGKGEEEKGK
jgi:hypothetical protein